MHSARPTRTLIHALAAGGALALAAITALAQPATDRRPDSARRTVALFDFEEFTTNPEPIPMKWRSGQDSPTLQRPDYDIAHAGQGSVRLPTRGGSTSLIIESGVIPVFPDADYRVSVMARTHGLRSARAFVEACLVDGTGQIIEPSRRRSPPIRTDGPWDRAEVTLWGEWPQAAFVRIELLLLQAEEFETRAPGYGRTWPRDVSGAAWFDDVLVIQQPRITLSTGAPGNVVTRPWAPSIDILTRDLAGETLEAQCRVYDVSGRLVATTSRRITQGRWQETWTPHLTDLGWYRAVVDVRSQGRRIGHGVLDFAWLPPEPAASNGEGGLGAVINGASATPDVEFARAVQAAGVEHLTISIWHRGLTTASMGETVERISRVLGALRSMRGRVAFALPIVPHELAELLGLREEQVSRALASDPSAWSPYLDPLLDQHGQSVARWQIGPVGDESVFGSSTLGDELAAMDAGLSRLVPGPTLVIPWRADRQPPNGDPGRAGRGDTGASADADPSNSAASAVRPVSGTPPPNRPREPHVEHSVLIPAATSPEGVESVVGAWGARETSNTARGSEGSVASGLNSATARTRNASFILERFDLDSFGARAAVIDLVKRAVFAWAASPAADPTLSLADPFIGGDHLRSPLMPRPELAVWRNLRDRLRGRRIVGELPMTPGTRCFILAPRTGDNQPGALVAWNDWANADDAVLSAMLTLGPVRVVDPMGNQRLVEPTTQMRGDLPARHHHIPLTDMPVFIEGIDVDLALLQASFRIEPGMLQTQATPHDIHLVLTNPWPTPISGRAFIVEPGGSNDDGQRDRSWRIEPRSFDFEALPGQEARMPLSVLMREFEPSGPTPWIIDLRLAGREDLGWITVSAPLTIGLEGIDLRLSTRAIGPDLEVEVTIANTRAVAIDLDATVFAPGFPRERRSIGQIMPRTQVTRSFTYPAGAAMLSGHTITASIRETDTGSRLNAAALVP